MTVHAWCPQPWIVGFDLEFKIVEIAQLDPSVPLIKVDTSGMATGSSIPKYDGYTEVLPVWQ